MKVTSENDEVLFTQDPITTVTRHTIDELKQKALTNSRERIRLCTHTDVNDRVHEMLIVHTKNNYVRPHKHLGKSESFHIIEGALTIVVFDEDGSITGVINLSDYTSGSEFFWRISNSFYHTVIPISDIVVFHETTAGPFRREDTIYPSWAPTDEDAEYLKTGYVQDLLIRSVDFLEKAK